MSNQTTFEMLIANQERTPYKYPIATNLLETIVSDPNRGTPDKLKDQAVEFANDTCPVIHRSVISHIENYLSTFKEYYGEITSEQFIHRLLTRRSLVFWEEYDDYKTPNGQTGSGWPYKSRNGPFLCYEEAKFSALLSVSTPTFFINELDRGNNGRVATWGSYLPDGVCYGGVGPRMEKANVMEWQECMVTPTQNTLANGYGPGGEARDPSFPPQDRDLVIWANFYGRTYLPTHEEVTNYVHENPDQERYAVLSNSEFFDKEIYAKRLNLTLEPYFIQTELFAKKKEKKAICHVQGLGLGVWVPDNVASHIPANIFVSTALEILARLPIRKIHSVIFSWFEAYKGEKPSKLTTGAGFTCNIMFNRRNPASLNLSEERNALPVPDDTWVSNLYPWDGMSYPGNEYWLGYLDASQDPATASGSCIGELQNPDVNVNNITGEKCKCLDSNSLTNHSGFVAVDMEHIDIITKEGYKCNQRSNVPLALCKDDLERKLPNMQIFEVSGLDKDSIVTKGSTCHYSGKHLAAHHLCKLD